MGSSDFRTLNELFLAAIERHPKTDAFLTKSSGGYQGVSSREALRIVAALAAGLGRLGAERRDRVALLSENRLEWALTDYALLGQGAVVVPIYPTLLERDIEFVLQDSGSKGIVVSTAAQLAKVLNIRSSLPELRFIVVMDRPGREVAGVLQWKQVVETQTDAGPQAIDFFCAKARETRPEDIASILYTSGTMGQPKGVVLTHANIVSNVHSSEGLFTLGRHDVGMSLLPLCHVYERMLDFHYFWLGVSIAYPESFEALPENLREVRPTVMAVVPRVLEKVHDKVMERVRQARPIMQKLFHWAFTVGKEYFPYRLERRTPPLGGRVKNALADALIFSRIRAQLGGRMAVLVSGAARLSPELAEFFCAIGLPVFEGYGLTETSPVITTNYPGCVKLGTVGRAVKGVEIKLGEKIEDQEGAIGREILVRGPNVTPGYYHLDDENRQAFVDGWFRTGDLGKLDSEGFLTITGRRKNLFKTSGGKFVSPEKLENLFQGHSNVSQVLILGDARKFIGALIVPNFERLEDYARDRGIAFKNHEDLVANQEIHHFMQEQVDALNLSLPPHERIRQFLLLPKEFTIASGELSATLKVKRRVVEERYRDQIEEMFLRHAPVQARN